MTYQPRPLASNDTLVASRDVIRQNFTLLRTNIEANHASVDSVGKHKFLQMPDQASDPATAVNEGALFVKPGTGPAESNLWYRSDDSGGTGGQLYQLTRVDETLSARFGTNTIYQAAAAPTPQLQGGWTFLPGGLIVNYGTITISTPSAGVSARTITFAKPFTSVTLFVAPSPFSTSAIYVTSITVNGCVVQNASGLSAGATVSWYAIGI